MQTSSETAANRLERFGYLRNMIGNTPLLGIRYSYRGAERIIYAKAEQGNLTGSIKDRMALHILHKAYQSGDIRPGYLIAEATSGNTGISFAAIGRALGHPVRIYMPDWMSKERIELIRTLGAEIVLVSREQGGFLGSIRLTEELAETRGEVFLPRQFSNTANVEAHELTTGPEIWRQLQPTGPTPQAFVAGIGTGGTVMGVGKYLRSQNSGIKIFPLEPAESPTMSTGRKTGRHRIQGISDEFIPAIVRLGEIDQVIAVHDGDAILMAQQLACQLGIAVGISSGANFLGAVQVQNMLGDSTAVVTIFPDDNKKYLSTDLLNTEPVKPGYLTPELRLTSYFSFQRFCPVCAGLPDPAV